MKLWNQKQKNTFFSQFSESFFNFRNWFGIRESQEQEDMLISGPGIEELKRIYRTIDLNANDRAWYNSNISYFSSQQIPLKLVNSAFDRLKNYPNLDSIRLSVLNLLKNDIEKNTTNADRPSISSEYETSGPPFRGQRKQIRIIRLETQEHGNKIITDLNMSPADRKKFMKDMLSMELAPQGINDKEVSYGGRKLVEYSIDFNLFDLHLFKEVRKQLENRKYDVSSLDRALNEANRQKDMRERDRNIDLEKSHDDPPLEFKNLENDEMLIKINYAELPRNKIEFLKEAIRFILPANTFNKLNASYTVKGNLSQYLILEKLLNSRNFEIAALRRIIRKKVNNGDLVRTHIEGEFDNNSKFLSEIQDKLPNLGKKGITLFEQQKKGIAFLYGRNAALLGDEAGVGKTLQLVSAAHLRMERDGGNTLILALSPTIDQWIKAIKDIVGEKNDYTTDLVNSANKKFTILKYETFSLDPTNPRNKQELDALIDDLHRANFQIVILDELHKLKHATTGRSANLENAIKNIPIRWGATATLSSNTPKDVKNQLKILNHPLGLVSDKRFEREFLGKKEGSATSKEMKAKLAHEAAEKLNRWLNLSGVYLRRSKKDVNPDLPEMTVNKVEVDIDQDEYQRIYREKLSKSKQPNLALTKLSASRESYAFVKTKKTAQRALEIVQNNEDNQDIAASRVLIFTNFVASFEELKKLLESGLKRINPKYEVLSYGGERQISESKRKQMVKKFSSDPNVKILILSMKMGSTGIDFPNAARTMLVNDFDWTPESADQSEGRIYRISTNKPVTVEYMITSGLDHNLFLNVEKKRELARVIQRFRDLYQKSNEDDRILKKIVNAQLALDKLEQEEKSLKSQDSETEPVSESRTYRFY